MSRAGRPPAPAVVQPYAAAGRDASWYAMPDVRSVKALHIVTVAGTAACNPGPEFRRCMPLDPNYHRGAEIESVYDDLRCRRPGCRVHWDKIPGKPRRGSSDTGSNRPAEGGSRGA